MNTNTTPTRRSFLAAAAPAALAVATGVSAVQPAATALATSKSPFHVDPVCRNNGQCRCRDCREGRGDAVLHCDCLVALQRLDTALWRLIDQDEADCTCWVCLDCRSLQNALQHNASALESTILYPSRGIFEQHKAALEAAKEADETHPPQEGVMIALHDALDAALAMTHGHCPHLDCDACRMTDAVVRPIRNTLDSFRFNFGATSAVAKRQIVTATRKLERLAENPLGTGGWMLQSRAEHEGVQEALAHAQFMLAAVERDIDPDRFTEECAKLKQRCTGND